MRHGASGKCPKCGEGRLFSRYTSVNEACPSCGEALHHQRADDFPPYLVIMILGHVIVPLMLLVERTWMPALWLHAAIWLPATLIGCLVLLPPVKGAVIGWQWAGYMHGFDPGAEDEHEAAARGVAREI